MTRVAFFLKRHRDPRSSPIMPEVTRLLAERAVDVEVIHPDEVVTDLTGLRVEFDLYVLKSRTDVSLGVAGALSELGASILNPYRVAAACRDKIVASQLLRTAGVPVPETYVSGRADRLAPLLAEGPLVVKPYRGSQGRGVRLVRTPGELADGSADGAPVYAQRYHEPRDRDLKIYRIGDRLFGVRRVWPARTYEEKLGEPFPVEGELRDLALRLGSALGITLYGFDVVLSDEGPFVVDFSPFPGFKGVPDAAVLLADYIEAAARRTAQRERSRARGSEARVPSRA